MSFRYAEAWKVLKKIALMLLLLGCSKSPANEISEGALPLKGISKCIRNSLNNRCTVWAKNFPFAFFPKRG